MLVIGIGTGRCGTVSLARLLNKQDGCKVTHEAEPLMPWLKEEATQEEREILRRVYGLEDPMQPYRIHAERFKERLKTHRLVGDVASFWLPYLDNIAEDFPDFKVIALIRADKQAFVESFVKKTGGEDGVNHWIDHDGTKWQRNIWSMIHPSYDAETKREALGRYYDDYNRAIMEMAKEHDNVLVVRMEDLSSHEEQDRIFAFLGIESYDYDDAHYNVGPSDVAGANPVREDAEGNSYELVRDESGRLTKRAPAGDVAQVHVSEKLVGATAGDVLDKPRIFIAMPNKVDIAWPTAKRLFEWGESGKYVLHVYGPMNVVPHHRARNVCHREFVQTQERLRGKGIRPFTHMLWVDSDTEPPEDAIDVLLRHDKDICGFLVQAWKDHGPMHIALNWNEKANGYSPHYREPNSPGVQRVDIASLACCLVKAEVMEAMPHGVFAWEETDEWGTKGWGEDFVFFRKAKDLGFETYVDYTALCRHYVRIDIADANKLLADVGRKQFQNGVASVGEEMKASLLSHLEQATHTWRSGMGVRKDGE